MLIFAVTGMGGIGKTALAIEAAHRASARGWFPGDTLFVDLRGYDDNPVTADQAVLALLDALGVRGADLPPTATQQYDAYRALLAERQERTLLILDNASDPAQFLELLPGTDRHRVLITSRDRPDSLPVRLIDLETLRPDDSVALVTRALHDADERDDRPAREPSALRELADLCGHLPLALQIAAAMLRRRRHRPVAVLVREIRDAGDPTAVLDNGSPGTDLYGRSLVLRPVLETSYRRLAPEQARLLRLLCLAPGTDSGTEAMAALADRDEGAVTGLLEDMAAASLVSPVQSGGRWRVHDLVRAFGAGVVARDAELREEGEEARERLLVFFWRWAYAANTRLLWLPGMAEPERFADRPQALAWLDRERAGLVAAVQWAGEGRYAHWAMRLALSLAEYLEWRRYFDDAITVAGTAREAACRAEDLHSETRALTDLGMALDEVGRAEEAIEAHTRSRDLYQAMGDLEGEADAWNNLGWSLGETGRTEEAIEAHTRSRDLYRTVAAPGGEADAWNNLGSALKAVGRTEEAIEAHTRALDLYRATGDHHRRGKALHNLGNVMLATGRIEDAIKAYSMDLEICRQFEDWYGTGQTLDALAIAHSRAHRLAEARAYYLEAADAYTRANAPDKAATAQSAADALT
ncbi:tetratricopeptide repeat protein [Streptomyces sp. NPDC050803]|uniref:tetratricopeptide repeat protein n=1 Tax=unclassified Streptomyces TaxID=2593676 RepID=UPI00343DE969